MEDRTVLVTGGAGGLGQHVINLLQTKVDDISEIRVLDLQPYSNKLGHPERYKVNCIVGSVTNWDTVHDACAGVDSVIHLAGYIDYSMFPDVQKLEAVNIQGTDNIVRACQQQNVRRLVYCSSAGVVMGEQDIVNGTETTTRVPDCFLFGPYNATKYKAEQIVLKGGHSSKLHTIVIRPHAMYGDEDKQVMYRNLEIAKKIGFMPRFGSGRGRHQAVYLGNVAWMFACAEMTLVQDPQTVRGNIFFCTDDTKVENAFDMMEPFLNSNGYGCSRVSVPTSIVAALLYIIGLFLWIISPICKTNMPSSAHANKYVDMIVYFSYDKARTLLSYKPLYSAEEAFDRSIRYYTNCFKSKN